MPNVFFTFCPVHLHIMDCFLFFFLLSDNDMHHYSVLTLCSLVVVWHQKHASSCRQATCLAVFDYETSSDKEAYYGWFEVECFFDFCVSLSIWTWLSQAVFFLLSCSTVVLQLVFSTFMFYSCFSNLSSLFLMSSLQKYSLKSNKQIHSLWAPYSYCRVFPVGAWHWRDVTGKCLLEWALDAMLKDDFLMTVYTREQEP